MFSYGLLPELHRISNVSGVLLSHEHGDHTKAVHEIMNAGITVYTGQETISNLGIRMQRMFDESREKVLAARNEEIEKAYQKGKEDGISRTVSALNKVVENAREEEREKSYNAGFEQGFTDGQNWANVENSVTLLLALHREYDFEPDQLMNVVEKSNKYVHQANEGKPTIGTLARQLYDECQIKLCEHEVEILRKYSLFEECAPYD